MDRKAFFLSLLKGFQWSKLRKFFGRCESDFKDNIWDADLADIELRSNYNKGFWFLLCATDVFSKYAWVIPLNDENDTTKY